MHGYQGRLADEIYTHNASCAVVRVGGGKTVIGGTAITDLLEDGVIRRALIIAPKKVCKFVWATEFEEWDHLAKWQSEIGVCLGTPQQRAAVLASGCKIVVINYDNISWLFGERKTRQSPGKPAAIEDYPELFDFALFDEISKLRSPSGKRAKRVAALAHKFKNIHGMTASIMPKGLENVFMPTRIVSRDKCFGASFYKWRETFFYTTDFLGYKWEPRQGAKEAVMERMEPWLYGVDGKEYPKQKKGTFLHRPYDLPPKAVKEYKRMDAVMVAEASEGHSILAASAASSSQKLTQLCSGFMYDEDKKPHLFHEELFDTYDDVREEAGGEPMLTYYWYKHTEAELRRRYPDMIILDDKQGQDVVDKWNAGEIPHMAVHPASAGHGLNIQFGARLGCWLELTNYDAELFEQACGRLVRSGQQRDVTFYMCYARDTHIEHQMMPVVERRLSEQEAFKQLLRRV